MNCLSIQLEALSPVFTGISCKNAFRLTHAPQPNSGAKLRRWGAVALPLRGWESIEASASVWSSCQASWSLQSFYANSRGPDAWQLCLECCIDPWRSKIIFNTGLKCFKDGFHEPVFMKRAVSDVKQKGRPRDCGEALTGSWRRSWRMLDRRRSPPTQSFVFYF